MQTFNHLAHRAAEFIPGTEAHDMSSGEGGPAGPAGPQAGGSGGQQQQQQNHSQQQQQQPQQQQEQQQKQPQSNGFIEVYPSSPCMGSRLGYPVLLGGT